MSTATKQERSLKFKSPLELVTFVDDEILSGEMKLHKWQAQIMTDFAKPSNDKDPFRSVVRAANGSGKDKYIIAPCAVWLGTVFDDSLCIITSASGNQLDRQTDRYIQQLMNGINRLFDQQIWKINYRHYTNMLNGSTIELFATDEPGRAEGWHPAVANGQFGIFVSEAKSISDDIFTALARCTGFTKRIDVSSPGLPDGHFYNACVGNSWKQYHVTAFDCPHLSQDYIDDVKNSYGENSTLYRSMILADFGGLEEQVVINFQQLVELAGVEVDHVKSEYNVAGLDLSAGGDEQVLAVRNGNKLIALESFKFTDTVVLIEHLEKLFYKYDLNNANAIIYGDAGGLGKPILDTLRANNWPVKYVLNQAKPINELAYLNRGAETWFNVAKLVENKEIIIPDYSTLRKQLASRYYTVTPQNKLQLESKKVAKSKGRRSPDQADAFVLAFCDYYPTKARGTRVKYKLNKCEPKPERKVFTLSQARNNHSIRHMLPKRDPIAQEFLLEEIKALR